MAKRYVLLVSDADLSAPEVKELRTVVEMRVPGAKLIEVEGNPRAVIVKTTNDAVRFLREPERVLAVGGKDLTPALTSGAVGNLKRRARGAGANGQVHE